MCGQDVEAVLKADPFKISGSIGQTTNFYSAANIAPRRPGFYWSLNANLNISLFGLISAPFSFNYSPQGQNLRYPYQNNQPFNQFGISPKYKAVTVHLGYRSMNFSEFSLSGNKFLGVGVEVKPKDSKWQYQLMSGRFARAIQDTAFLNANTLGLAYFDRYGVAMKTKHNGTNGFSEYVFFRAWDAQRSASIDPVLITEAPQENLIVSFKTKKTFFKKLNLEFEYAASAYTRDIRSERVKLESASYLDNMGFLFRSRASSQYNGALKSSAGYTFGNNAVKLGYRRLGPEYTSMGIPFMNNDFQDITLSWNRKLFKNNMNLVLSGGLQENNLKNTKVSKMTRLIGNAQANAKINKRLNINARYANFNSSTRMIRINQLDSLNYYQVTNNMGGGFSCLLGNSTSTKKSLIGNVNYQLASDVNQVGAKNVNGVMGYNLNVSKKAFTISAMVNVNANSVIGFDHIGIGPVLNVNKTIRKKIKLGASFNQLNYTNQGTIIDQTNNARFNLGYSYRKSHNLNLNYTWINKENKQNNILFTEHVVVVQYGYTFQYRVKSKAGSGKGKKQDKAKDEAKANTDTQVQPTGKNTVINNEQDHEK